MRFFPLKILLIFSFLQLNFAHSRVENKIIVKIDNQIITSYELKNKILTTLTLSKRRIDQESINDMKQQALNSLINLKLKKEQILKRKIKVSKDEITAQLNNVYSRYKTDEQSFKNIFKNNNLDYDLFINEITTEVSWQQLIMRLYSNKIQVDEIEIDNEIKETIKTQTGIKEYKLAEIEVPFANEIIDDKAIKEVTNQINIIGFEKAAIKFSVSMTASEGGNIGWINAKSLSDKILLTLENMKLGEVSKPIIQSNNAIFIKLLDKKNLNINDIDIEKLKNQIINVKRNEIYDLYSNNHLSKIKNNTYIQFN